MLLARLSTFTEARPRESEETADALKACANEILRVAARKKDADLRSKLGLFADLLLEGASAIGRNERRWSRLAFDLHDGAQQEISALRMDLGSLSAHIKKSLGDESELIQALASARELDARLKGLDAGLRELVESFDTPALPDLPLPTIVQETVAEFTASTGIGTSVNIKGEFASLTQSQRITLVRVLAESLANIRQHAGATRVRVALRTRARRVYLVVRDNGCGFAAEKALRRAAKRRRLGLIGMTERARLLGGTLDIQSEPGGPTAISLTLPAGDVGASTKQSRRRLPQ